MLRHTHNCAVCKMPVRYATPEEIRKTTVGMDCDCDEPSTEKKHRHCLPKDHAFYKPKED